MDLDQISNVGSALTDDTSRSCRVPRVNDSAIPDICNSCAFKRMVQRGIARRFRILLFGMAILTQQVTDLNPDSMKSQIGRIRSK